jgi:hypothetical protein
MQSQFTAMKASAESGWWTVMEDRESDGLGTLPLTRAGGSERRKKYNELAATLLIKFGEEVSASRSLGL